SGKRRGATCAYLETWHYDFEDFIDLRRNTGDERRRTHDMNTAAWVPDLFMKRVLEDEKWTLFSSDEVPDLHHTYGADFEKRYVAYEKKAREGGIRKFKTLQAKDLWRKMLTRLFETGHPWITFKDPCNIRSPQDHAGVIHGSNLCTEITLNTSEDEIAVCNLGSINLYKHVTKQGGLDKEKIAQTVQSAIRMLDNVIDLNYYPTIEAKNSNMRHRPIGMGIMGFQDALFTMGVSFADTQARELADEWMEVISYSAILSSSKLAKERGAYKSYNGSKWDKNLFPLDTIELLEKERGMPINVSRTSKLDWTPVRKHVKDYGMRNSNTMAIAPTSNVANITSVYPSLEPIYKNIYVKSNISGEFTIVNKHLVRDLKAQGLWNKEMLEKLKYADGRLSRIAGIPEKIKQKYLESFEIDPSWQVELTAARAKWIDQSQSHNIFMEGTSGKKLEEIYFQAWHTGLKTTYYLRTLGATQIEKSTLDTKYGFTQKREYKEIAQEPLAAAVGGEQKLCKIEDPDCEACQ
ncbi:ribonucleoside-diphosphate reductase subunit alpha, partial [archaeon CG10_big_fil_rev_8_21_14_0_10_43_11]